MQRRDYLESAEGELAAARQENAEILTAIAPLFNRLPQ